MLQNSDSFQAVLFSLLTYGEIKAFSELKTFIFANKERTARKELIKRTVILGHVNWLNV